jgi:hypothetical protein
MSQFSVWLGVGWPPSGFSRLCQPWHDLIYYIFIICLSWDQPKPIGHVLVFFQLSISLRKLLEINSKNRSGNFKVLLFPLNLSGGSCLSRGWSEWWWPVAFNNHLLWEGFHEMEVFVRVDLTTSKNVWRIQKSQDNLFWKLFCYTALPWQSIV